MDLSTTRAVRTLLVSDVHLGCKHSQAAEFLSFLRQYRPDNLYLVGDFLDGWKINTGWHWPKACDEVIDHVVHLARNGTKVFYTPGNHDSFLRQHHFQDMVPGLLPHCEVSNDFVHVTAGGWRLLVTHGDLFDVFETKAQWISKGSSFFYDSCLATNRFFSRMLPGKERNPYGVCAVLKDRVKRAVRFISSFESKLFDYAKKQDCEGVVCGHIHTPTIINTDSMLYLNTGDWVENCTALVEDHEGRFELISRYAKQPVTHVLRLDPKSGSVAGNQPWPGNHPVDPVPPVPTPEYAV